MKLRKTGWPRYRPAKEISMKNNRQMTASLLFAAAFGLSVFFGFFQAFGALAGPGAAFESEAQKHGYDEETWQRLMDDTHKYEKN